MRHFFNFATISLMSLACLKATAQTYYKGSGKSRTAIIMIERDGFTLSPDCADLPCQAYGATKESPNPRDFSLRGNPAAVNCFRHNATSSILKDEKGNEDSFCVFPDGSFIESWDLYYHFNTME